jgi:hypothetical protein
MSQVADEKSAQCSPLCEIDLRAVRCEVKRQPGNRTRIADYVGDLLAAVKWQRTAGPSDTSIRMHRKCEARELEGLAEGKGSRDFRGTQDKSGSDTVAGRLDRLRAVEAEARIL